MHVNYNCTEVIVINLINLIVINLTQFFPNTEYFSMGGIIPFHHCYYVTAKRQC